MIFFYLLFIRDKGNELQVVELVYNELKDIHFIGELVDVVPAETDKRIFKAVIIKVFEGGLMVSLLGKNDVMVEAVT